MLIAFVKVLGRKKKITLLETVEQGGPFLLVRGKRERGGLKRRRGAGKRSRSCEDGDSAGDLVD